MSFSPFKKVVSFLADLEIQTEPCDELTIKALSVDVLKIGEQDVLTALQETFPTLYLLWGNPTKNYHLLERHPYGVGFLRPPRILSARESEDLVSQLEHMVPSPSSGQMVGISRWLYNQNIQHEFKCKGTQTFILLPCGHSIGKISANSQLLPIGLPAVAYLHEVGIQVTPRVVKETLDTLNLKS